MVLSHSPHVTRIAKDLHVGFARACITDGRKDPRPDRDFPS